MLFEYNKEKEMAKLREEEREEGEEKRAVKIATKMIEDGFDTAMVTKYSMLSKKQVLKLKKQLGK